MFWLFIFIILADPTRVTLTQNFSAIRASDVGRLDGKVVRFVVDRTSRVDGVMFDADGPDDLHRTVWLREEQEVGWRVVVEGRLRVIRHGPSPDGVFPSFIELRIEDARINGRPI